MSKPEKIRPPTHSSLQPSPKELREEGEGDLPDMVRAPDPGARQSEAEPGDGVFNVSLQAGGQAPWPEVPPGATLDPTQAAKHRRQHNEPNKAYGKPPRATTADQLLANYQRTLREHREEYRGTRSNAKERPYLEAKQAMIDAGLLVGDV